MAPALMKAAKSNTPFLPHKDFRNGKQKACAGKDQRGRQ